MQFLHIGPTNRYQDISSRPGIDLPETIHGQGVESSVAAGFDGGTSDKSAGLAPGLQL
jgi:hypothetical protein